MFGNKQYIIITMVCFQLLDKVKIVKCTPGGDVFCKNLCPIDDRHTGFPNPASEESCKKHCFVKVEVEDFGRRTSILQWKNNTIANVVLSPFSIGVLINLLMLGTNGKTNMEIRGAIGYSKDLNETTIHEEYKKFFSRLHGSERGVELYFHTALFFQTGINILSSFQNIARNSYISNIDYLDFQSSPELSGERINTWVSNNTEGRVTQIISNVTSSNTKCIGVSLITFKSSWAFGFDSSLTKNGIFNTGSADISIPMMTTLMNTLYFRDKGMGFEIISLPFMMNSYAMYILQPINISITELQKIEKTLGPSELYSLFNNMKSKFMEVSIPRMKLELKLNLKKDLMSFGINQIFNNGANFERLTQNPELLINDLIHVGVLEITEAGINANIVSKEFSTIKEGSFVLNKPSLLFIRDKDNKLIVFWAKVVNPEPLFH